MYLHDLRRSSQWMVLLEGTMVVLINVLWMDMCANLLSELSFMVPLDNNQIRNAFQCILPMESA